MFKQLMRKYSVVLILLVVAVAAVSTHLVLGFPRGHSIYFNIYWQKYFTEQLLAGEIFPRWLFNDQQGMGSPVFYFYAPAPFYLFSAVALVCGPLGGDFTTLTVGHMMIFFLSGCAFFIFISRYLDKLWASVVSMLYIFLPYHYVDLEVRSAIGESFAYIWIPLIMTGLCRSKKTWKHLVFSAFCYAGLILSHLPSALIAAPVIGIFSLCATPLARWVTAVGYACFIGIAGVAISAFYLVPAILLLDTIPHDAWVTGAGRYYQAENWLIGNAGLPPFGIKMYVILAVTTLAGLGMIIVYRRVCLLPKQAVKDEGIIVRIITACLLSLLGCWLLMTNLSRPVWENLPFISQIQFPWRAGIIIDFCSLFLLGVSVPGVIRKLLSRASLAPRQLMICERIIASFFLVVVAVTVMAVFFPPTVNPGEEIVQYTPPEYRPKWLVESAVYLPAKNLDDLADITYARRIHYEGMSRWKKFVDSLPPILSLRGLEPGEEVRLDEKTTSSSIVAKLLTPAVIIIRKIYYPHWRLISKSGEEIEIFADPRTGLVLCAIGPGEHELTLERRLLPQEQIGGFISLISVITLVAVVIFCGRRAV